MSLANRLRPLATRLLSQLSGHSVTFRANAEAAYVPGTGLPAPTATDTLVWAYEARPNAREMSDGTVQATDIVFIISAEELATEPKPGDQVISRGVTLNVVRVEIVSGGALAVLYRAIARKT